MIDASPILADVVELALRDIAREQTDFIGRMSQSFCTFEGLCDDHSDGEWPDDDRDDAIENLMALAGMALAQVAFLTSPKEPASALRTLPITAAEGDIPVCCQCRKPSPHGNRCDKCKLDNLQTFLEADCDHCGLSADECKCGDDVAPLRSTAEAGEAAMLNAGRAIIAGDYDPADWQDLSTPIATHRPASSPDVLAECREVLTEIRAIAAAVRETSHSVAMMRRKVGPIATKAQSDGWRLARAIELIDALLAKIGAK